MEEPVTEEVLEEPLTLESFPVGPQEAPPEFKPSPTPEPAPDAASKQGITRTVIKHGPVKVRVRHAEKKRGETGLNARVLDPLGSIYGDQRAEILNQAVSAYHFHNPQAQTEPEPYELFEGQYIDEALKTLGLKDWIIGRPRLG